MKASVLIAEVQRVLYKADYSGDKDYESADILPIINRGRIEIAGGADRQDGRAKLAPLPDLLTTGTLTASAGSNTVTMGSTFQRGLHRVTITAGDKLKKYHSLQKMLDRYENESGVPEAYHLKGRTLWIAPKPLSETSLTAYFHRYPVDLVIAAAVVGPPAVPARDDEPTELPEHLQMRLLTNFALKEIYTEIESGMGGEDGAKHEVLYQRALSDLDRHIGPEEDEAQNIDDDYLTEDNIW